MSTREASKEPQGSDAKPGLKVQQRTVTARATASKKIKRPTVKNVTKSACHVPEDRVRTLDGAETSELEKIAFGDIGSARERSERDYGLIHMPSRPANGEKENK